MTQATHTSYRDSQLATLEQEPFDLLIIGGGITGAGIALDAVTRGLRVALVEKADFASGTSSRSTKLIHGGLRYLKQFEFALVREVGRERAILFENAPHLVIPEQMLLPIIKGGTFGKLGVSVGLWVYDFLAGVKKSERRRMFSRAKTLDTEPLLRKDILKGAGFYTEYRTDDARLTVEVMKTAVQKGAVALNYCQAEKFIHQGEKVAGITARDVLADRAFEIKAKVVVNAAGPWVDMIRKIDNSLKGKRLHHTKGIHIVVPHARLPITNSIYFDAEGGRMVFAIPRDGTTYIGTTDTNYKGQLEEPGVTEADLAYLLKAANDMFPETHLVAGDVISNWSGIRPLIHEDGKSPSDLSRKDEIFYSPSGLITIAGGKLTGFRKMAERVTDVVMKRISSSGKSQDFVSCSTDKIELSGGDIPQNDLYAFRKSLEMQVQLPQGIVHQVAGWLGSNSLPILQAAEKAVQAQGVSPEIATIREVALYCIQHEFAVDLTDFFIRRTGMLYFEPKRIQKLLAPVADIFAGQFGWTATQQAQQISALNTFITLHHTIQPAN